MLEISFSTSLELKHVKKRCYYKCPEGASQNFRERFKDLIKKLQSKVYETRPYINVEIDIENVYKLYSSRNWGFMAPNKRKI